jgi:hypothetical protein
MLPVHQLVAVNCTSACVGGGRKGTSGGGRCVWSMPWRLADGGLGHMERNWAGWAREAEDEIAGWATYGRLCLFIPFPVIVIW